MEKINKLFVYGTLKHNYLLHGYIKHLKFIDNAKLKDFKMFSCGSFPAIVKEIGFNAYGEVYELSEKDFWALMPSLDMIEAGYNREVHEVETSGGIKCLVYVYVYKSYPSNWIPMPSGMF